MEKVAIFGTGGFAREVAWMLSGSQVQEAVGFVVDPSYKELWGQTICGLPVLGGREWLYANPEVKVVCALGDPRDRARITRELERQGLKFVTIIHDSIRKSEFVEIGQGCVICSGVTLTTQINLGNHVHVNLNATIGHDVIVGDYVTISPGANISGNVKIGDGAYIGTNAAILERKNIGKGAVIGLCAAVVKDVEANDVVVGVPAKPIKKIEPFI